MDKGRFELWLGEVLFHASKLFGRKKKMVSTVRWEGKAREELRSRRRRKVFFV
jgi:hypothetical protein